MPLNFDSQSRLAGEATTQDWEGNVLLFRFDSSFMYNLWASEELQDHEYRQIQEERVHKAPLHCPWKNLAADFI